MAIGDNCLGVMSLYGDAVQKDSEQGDESSEVADRIDGASVGREHIQGVFTYTVELEEDTEIPDRLDATELAENIGQSRAQKELDPTFSISHSDVRAVEKADHAVVDADRQFEVTVQFAQND